MPLYCGLEAKFYWMVCQNCTLRVHRNVSMGSIFFEKNAFQIVFHIFGANFSGFRQNFSIAVVRTALVSRFFHLICARFCGIHAKTFWLVCQNCSLRVHRIVFHEKHLIWKKNTLPIVFLILRGSFSGFWANLSQRGSRNCIGFQAFQSDLCQFFIGLHAKFYWLVCQNCTLRARRIVFMGSIFFEKNSFQILFPILDGDFSGFRRLICSTVVKIALDSMFLIRIFAFFRNSRKIL